MLNALVWYILEKHLLLLFCFLSRALLCFLRYLWEYGVGWSLWGRGMVTNLVTIISDPCLAVLVLVWSPVNY